MELMSTDYHPKVRAIFNRGFTPKTLASLETWVRELTVQALDGIEPGQVADFVESLAVPVPVYVIAELLGVSATDAPISNAGPTTSSKWSSRATTR